MIFCLKVEGTKYRILAYKICNKQTMFNRFDSIVMAKQQTNNIATTTKSVSSISVLFHIKAYNLGLNL